MSADSPVPNNSNSEEMDKERLLADEEKRQRDDQAKSQKIKEGQAKRANKKIDVKKRRTKSKSKSKSKNKGKEESEDQGEGGGGPKITEPDMIVKLASDITREFFVDQYEQAYAALTVKNHMEILGMNKKRFRDFVGGTYYDATEMVPKPESVKSARKTLYERVASGDDRGHSILYDMTNPMWEVIRITPVGWDYDKNPTIVFRRHYNEQPQVYPTKKYASDIFDQFMKLLNIKGDDNKLLIKVYIVCLFVPAIQKPILMLHGEQGAAKSTLQEIVKLLVDPRMVATLAFPTKREEMVQQLFHHYLAYYDNISQIRDWISDILCRTVTGSGYSKRQLYTDDDDTGLPQTYSNN